VTDGVINQIPRVSQGSFCWSVPETPKEKGESRDTEGGGLGGEREDPRLHRESILAAINQSTNLVTDGVINQIPRVSPGSFCWSVPETPKEKGESRDTEGRGVGEREREDPHLHRIHTHCSQSINQSTNLVTDGVIKQTPRVSQGSFCWSVPETPKEKRESRDTEGGGLEREREDPPPRQGSILTAINQSIDQSSNRIPQVHRDRFVGVSLRPLKKKGNRGTQREGGGGRERERDPHLDRDPYSLQSINQSTNLVSDGVIHQIPRVRL
jgi:hypothetical protein